MEQAITKAVEGGYNFDSITCFEESDSHYSDVWYFHKGFDYLIPEMQLDPLFWQALGKALNFGRGYFRKTTWDKMSESSKDLARKDASRLQMHRFIDHLIARKDPSSFFNELLK